MARSHTACALVSMHEPPHRQTRDIQHVQVLSAGFDDVLIEWNTPETVFLVRSAFVCKCVSVSDVPLQPEQSSTNYSCIDGRSLG